MSAQRFDVIVLGAGPGGYPAALRAAQRGKKVALIEEKWWGGTCLHEGCIPSKALIAGGRRFADIATLPQFGIHVSSPTLDYEKLVAHKDRVVEKMFGGLTQLLRAEKNLTLIEGRGTLLSPKQVRVEGQKTLLLEAESLILATGSVPKKLPLLPVDGKVVVDSTGLLQRKSLPKKLVIVGGGIIGCEFASLYASLGVSVTIVELLPRILPGEPEEISQGLSRAFLQRGINLELHYQLHHAEVGAEGVRLHAEGRSSIEADLCLVAIGRSLRTEQIGLEKAGIQKDSTGLIPVSQEMQTAVRGVYAVGDIASRCWLAHVATHQGLVAADHICGKKVRFSDQAIPSVIFTDPEIATVGLSLTKAREKGLEAKESYFPFGALGKAESIGKADGFFRIVFDPKTGQILGAQAMGYEAGALIGEMALAIENELTMECVAETIHAHPTLSEGWMEAALQGIDLPLHMRPARR